MGLQKRLGYKARKKDSPRKRTVRMETSRWEERDGGEESKLRALSQDSDFTHGSGLNTVLWLYPL